MYLSICSGTEFCYLTSDGRCVQRKDLSSEPVSTEEIVFNRNEIDSKQYDRKFEILANISDLDIKSLTSVANSISRGMTPEKCLQYLDLAEFHESKLLLKKAALLLFAKDINKWHPRVQVRVIRVEGNDLRTGKDYNAKYDSSISSCITNLIESSWELLRPHLTETRISEDAIFKTQIIYPELACREALINAIAHRDYNNEGAGIEIYVYDNRIEVVSPGGLLSSISLEDLKSLKGVHQSRNSLVSRVLREIGYMRELGEGIRRIFDLMNSNDLAAPQIESSPSSFRITLFQKYVYTTEEKLWLDNFSGHSLSRAQKTIIRLGCDGRIFSTQEIWSACGIVDTEEYRKLVESLYDANILENIYSGQQSRSIASKKRIPHKQVKKFRIVLPQKGAMKTERQDEEHSDFSKIFVGNLPYNVNQQNLLALFGQFGTIEEIFIPIEYQSQRPKGFAFIEFTNKEDAKSAIEQSKVLEMENRKLFINWANPRHA